MTFNRWLLAFFGTCAALCVPRLAIALTDWADRRINAWQESWD